MQRHCGGAAPGHGAPRRAAAGGGDARQVGSAGTEEVRRSGRWGADGQTEDKGLVEVRSDVECKSGMVEDG